MTTPEEEKTLHFRRFWNNSDMAVLFWIRNKVVEGENNV